MTQSKNKMTTEKTKRITERQEQEEERNARFYPSLTGRIENNSSLIFKI